MENLYQRAKKGARVAALGGLTALSLAGCANRNTNDDFLRADTVGNLVFGASLSIGGRHVVIEDTSESKGNLVFLSARDHTNDGKFDEIITYQVPRDSKVRLYLNSDSIEAVYNRLAPQDSTQRGSQ